MKIPSVGMGSGKEWDDSLKEWIWSNMDPLFVSHIYSCDCCHEIPSKLEVERSIGNLADIKDYLCYRISRQLATHCAPTLLLLMLLLHKPERIFCHVLRTGEVNRLLRYSEIFYLSLSENLVLYTVWDEFKSISGQSVHLHLSI